MKKTLKKYFIPQRENNYHPHILHTKRTIFYSAFFLISKLILVLFVLALPLQVFTLPDVVAQEQKKLLLFTNQIRSEQGLLPLTEVVPLDSSAQSKANDMAKFGYFSHFNLQQKTVADLVKATGYKYKAVGENLAMGFSSAEEVIKAWQKSPTHYANLLDKDYQDFGVGMQSGEYEQVPTVFVAMHLAEPLPGGVKVLGEKIVSLTTTTFNQVEPLNYQAENSKVFWQETSQGTLLTVHAQIGGAVKSAQVQINNYLINLQYQNNHFYSGQLLIPESTDELFKVIILPTIKVVGEDGEVLRGNIDWFNVKIVSPTPWQSYLQAKDNLSVITKLFMLSHWIYLFFILFFGAALLLNIFIEFKKQHPHVILQTLGLLGLLVCLFII